MENRFEKLEEGLEILDSEGLSDVAGFGRLLAADHQIDPPPPTSEEWGRLPRSLKLEILAIVVFSVMYHWSWMGWLQLACRRPQK